MKTRTKALVGVAAVAVAAAGGACYVAVGGAGGHGRSGFCAQMPDAVGLYPGNPVTHMGYPVGHVDRVTPEGDYVDVAFTLDNGRSFPADVRAVTRSKSILADRSLELVGNTGDGPALAAGRCIPLAHSYTPKSLSEIASSAADFINELSPNDGRQSLQNAVAGLAQALRGQGQDARTLMLHASAAATSPDQLTSDLGTIILNMAPLTDEALQRWSTIRPLLDQLPEAAAGGIDLWPGVVDTCVGVGWLVNVLHDIQTNYGDDIWPVVQGPVADAVHLAASHAKDLADLLDSLPSVAAMLRRQSRPDGDVSVVYRPPTVRVGTPDGGHIQVPAADLLGAMIAKGRP